MDIIKVIQETATWIEKVNNNFNTNLFRSEELSPHYYYYEIPESGKLSAIDRIISTRSALLSESGINLIPVSELHHYGRIMVFDPDSTVVDGAPEAESACYVDIGDTPPWDTWLALGEQLTQINFYKPGHDINAAFLIAWVPESHYFYANGALEVACMDNFAWPSNEFISNNYDSIKELFCKPEIVVPNPAPFYYDNTIMERSVVLQELNHNSKLYYNEATARFEGKKSFWDKLAIWKARK
jgi:hypothetical protein